jgi:hypothetical protein
MPTATKRITKRAIVHETREQWLQAAVELLRPILSNVGHEFAKKVRIGCGYTDGGRRSKAIGNCAPSGLCDDGVVEIIINTDQLNGVRVLAILLHELVHAGFDQGHRISNGHGKKFADICYAAGLKGKATATREGDDLAKVLASMISKTLGRWPSERGMGSGSLAKGSGGGDGDDGPIVKGPPVQTTRMKKGECACGFTCRATQKQIAALVSGDKGSVGFCPTGCDQKVRTLLFAGIGVS